LALAHGHEVSVAHSGAHEPPGDLKMKRIHGERDALLALDGPIARATPDVLIDTRTMPSRTF
jgi:hypothetical protein